MESNIRKFTYLAFFILAALSGYVGFLLCGSLLDLFKVSTQIRVFDGGAQAGWVLDHTALSGIAAGVVGLGTWLALAFNLKAVEYTDECVSELWRVTWPTRKETTASTIVVSIMVLIAALTFLLMDIVWSNLFRWVL